MRIKADTIIAIAFFVIFYTGFQGGRYYMANRVQEIGLLFSMGLFFYSAILCSLYVKDKDLRWNWWFFSTLFFVAYTFILPAYRFSENFDVPMLPSVMASREYLIIFFGPAIYFLYRLGYDIRRIERIFVAALVVLAFNYIFHYFRLDLVAAYFSTDPTIAGLVTHDDWRGYRLKPSTVALFTLSVLTFFMLITGKGAATKMKWFLVLGTIGFIWSLVMARSMAASLIMGSILFPLFFAYKYRVGLFIMALPAIFMLIGAIVVAIGGMLEGGGSEGGDGVRIRSYNIALDSVQERPFFGIGQQSNFTKTEQDIFWYKFFSADLGIIGTTFKYGILGGAIYVIYSIWLIQRLVSTIWLYRTRYGVIHPVMYSMLVVFLALFINIMLNPMMVYIPGLTLGAFTIGLTSSWRHKIKKEMREAKIQAWRDAKQRQLETDGLPDPDGGGRSPVGGQPVHG